MDTMSFPEWIYDLLKDPECHDSEHGRSCHFCGSEHGKYNEPLEHYIDCPWVIACGRIGIWPEGHAIYEPTMREPCEKCGWYYDSPGEWRGRELPRPACTQEHSDRHDYCLAERYGVTVEEFRADELGIMTRWYMKQWSDSILVGLSAARGGISFVKPPDLSDEAIRSPEA